MDISTLIAGLLTIAILTFLYRDNPIYKFAEYLLVGVSIGYALVIAWTSTMMDLLFEPLAGGKFSLIVPLNTRPHDLRADGTQVLATLPHTSRRSDRFRRRRRNTGDAWPTHPDPDV